MMRCYIFDIDGTLADVSHRLPHIEKEPKDWEAFLACIDQDTPIPHMVRLARDLSYSGAPIVYMSERTDDCRAATETWLWLQELPFGRVFLRPLGDRRPGAELKREMLLQLRAEGYEPTMVFEDRNSVVQMWREIGVPCA